MGEVISYDAPGGGSVAGYLAPAAGSNRHIVVIQEWWGLNDQIKGVADRFAAAGYNALAPDLYAGRVTQDPDEANHLMTGLDWVGATDEDLVAAVDFLKSDGGSCAVMGFCMGGALTILAAARIPAVDAGVCFYGIPPADQADPATIRIPLQGHFANQDDWCTPAAVDALDSALENTGAVHEFFRYDAAHGFFNETVEAFDAGAADASWQRTLDFLTAQL